MRRLIPEGSLVLTRLSLMIAASIAFTSATNARATPISYAFTGQEYTLNNKLYTFSGTFTFDADRTLSGDVIPIAGNPSSVTETGSDVSMTLTIGGHTFNAVNRANSVPVVTFTEGLTDTWVRYREPPAEYEAMMLSDFQGANPNNWLEFSVSFYKSAIVGLPVSLRDFQFTKDNANFFIDGLIDGNAFQSNGLLTSIELIPTPTPEPSSLAIFGLFGALALARHYRSRPRRRDPS